MTQSSRYGCPQCGSRQLKLAPVADNQIVLVRDFVCQDCGTRFTPPISFRQALTLILCGGFLMAAGGFLLAYYFVNVERPGATVAATCTPWAAPYVSCSRGNHPSPMARCRRNSCTTSRPHGKELWQSKPIAHNHQRTQECVVDVTGVDVLELRVHCLGYNLKVDVVWVEPHVLQTKNAEEDREPGKNPVDPVGKDKPNLETKNPKESEGLFLLPEIAPDAKLTQLRPGDKAFLSDLSEFAFKTTPLNWPFAKKWTCGGSQGTGRPDLRQQRHLPQGAGNAHPTPITFGSVTPSASTASRCKGPSRWTTAMTHPGKSRRQPSL